jgi:hypothetical protein
MPCRPIGVRVKTFTQPELFDFLQSPVLGLGNSPPDKQERGDGDNRVEQKNSRSGEHGHQRKKSQCYQKRSAPRGRRWRPTSPVPEA